MWRGTPVCRVGHSRWARSEPVAAVRSGNTMYLFIDGIMHDSGTTVEGTFTDVSSNLTIGGNVAPDTGFGDWDGEISSSPDMERFNCFLLLLPGVDDDEFVLLWLLLLLLLLLLFPLLLIPCKFPLLLLLFGVGGRLRCL